MTNIELEQLDELENQLKESLGAVLALDMPDGGKLVALNKDGFLALITSYRELQKVNAVSVKAVNGFIELQTKDRATIKELLEAIWEKIVKWYPNNVRIELDKSEFAEFVRLYTKHSTDTEVKE